MKKRIILLLSATLLVLLSASMLFGCNKPIDPNGETIPSVPVIDDNNPSNPSQNQTPGNPTEGDSNSSDGNFSIMDGDNHIEIE